MSVIKITRENFENEVVNSNKPVLIDFYADWCGPCRMMGPIIEELANESDAIKVCKVKVDEQSELASQFKVMSIPTLVAFKDGKVINTAVGVRNKEEIEEMF